MNKSKYMIIGAAASVFIMALGAVIGFLQGYRFGYGAAVDYYVGADSLKPARKWALK